MDHNEVSRRSTPQAKIDQRKHRRHIVLLRLVQLERQARRRSDAHVSEISVYGCRIYTKAKLEPGDKITLCLDNIQMTKAVIVWRTGAAAGCRFILPIGMDVIRLLAFDID
jgi:PilZ domain